MVYCFDYDSTIDDVDLHGLVLKLRRQNNEIWVVTARRENAFNIGFMMPVLSKLGLTKFNIIFCNNKPKWEILKGLNADVYVDNISDEFALLKSNTNVTPFLWK